MIPKVSWEVSCRINKTLQERPLYFLWMWWQLAGGKSDCAQGWGAATTYFLTYQFPRNCEELTDDNGTALD